MGPVLSTRYSDKDLGIFRKLILGKIEREYLIDAFDSCLISDGGEYFKKL